MLDVEFDCGLPDSSPFARGPLRYLSRCLQSLVFNLLLDKEKWLSQTGFILESEFVGCFVGSVVEDRAATFSTRFKYQKRVEYSPGTQTTEYNFIVVK